MLEKRELVALLLLCSECHVSVIVLGLLLAVPLVGLQCVIGAFPGHTHLLFALCCLLLASVSMRWFF